MSPSAPPASGLAQPIAARTTNAWRSQALVRIEELRYQVRRLTDARADNYISKLLDEAGCRANLRWRWWDWRAWGNALTGADVEFVWRAIHAADVELLQLTSDLAGRSSEIDATAATYLPASDTRRVDLHSRFIETKGKLAEPDRGAAVAAYRAALAEYDNQQKRVRSFRNTLLVACFVLTIAALLAVPVAGHALNLCATAPDATKMTICPTGTHPTGAKDGDIFLVELLGASAAMLVGATSLSRVRGTAGPYALPILAALLKVPAGALTAVLGLVLILADFGPGIKLGTTAQVDAWAILFGAAQHTFTQLVDRQAQTVLNNVGSTDKASPQNQ